MRIAAWLQISMCIVGLFSKSLCGGVEDMFAGIQSAPPENGLVFEIAVPKQTYFFFEPVTVLARFRNTTDNPVALAFETDRRVGIARKLRWNSSSLDGKPSFPSTVGSTLENVLLIPEHAAVYVALPDKMFPIGRTEISIEYNHSQGYAQPPLVGAEIWQGTVKSNTIVITSEHKETLTPEEQKQVTEKIWRHIEVFKSEDSMTSYLAQQHLIPLAKYSVPILRGCLTNKDRRIRLRAIETLGKIANTEITQKNGVERDVSSLDDLIAAYDRERDPQIKLMVVDALANFKGMPAEEHARIVQTLLKAIDHPNRGLHSTAAAVLLQMSPKDGIPEVIDKMADSTYFGDYQSNIVELLKKETGQDFGTAGPSRPEATSSAKRGWILPALIGAVAVGIAVLVTILLLRKRLSRMR
jgi:hypothetical protein